MFERVHYHALEIHRKCLLVQSLLLNLDQKCTYERFESGPKSQTDHFCSTLKSFECALLVQFRNKTGRKGYFRCIRDIELFNLNTFLGQKLDPAYNFFILYKSTDDDDINLGKPVQQKVQPLKAPNSRNLPSRQRQIIIDDFSSSSSEDEQPNNREEDEDVCAGVGTSMLYPYSGDDTILETPERAPKVPG